VSEPVLIEIAAALAAKTAESLYNLVRNKFKGRKQALDTLNAANGAPKDSPQVIALAEELATAEAYDPQFSEQLRRGWAEIQTHNVASGDGVANSVSGNVKGSVVQARDIHGNISFGS
jgi:hypothetical protein